jgi:hypothetical protein
LRCIARVRLLLVVALVLLPSVAHAGEGLFVPPMRIDLGPQMSSEEARPAFQVVAGIHWASLYPKKSNIDVGIGIVSDSRGTAEDTMTTSGGRAVVRPGEDRLQLFGGYVEVATRTGGNSWWRNWVGTRIESGRADVDHGKHAFVGVATRVSTEAYVAGGSGGGNGILIGVFAVGFYGELSARKIDDVGNDYGVSFGVTMRVPLIAVN